MKIKFNRAALQDALSLVTSVVPARTPKPILQCLRITSEADAVTMCATDLEIGLNYQIVQVEVEEPGDVVLPADKLASIVRESTDEVITLETSDSTIRILGSDSFFTIYGHEPEQFPSVAGPDGESSFEIDLEALQRGIELTVFAAARESTRYALNGILWEVTDSTLNLVATDGRRLAKVAVKLGETVDAEMPPKIIVPAKTMSLIDRIGAGEGQKVGIRFADNQVIMECGQAIVSSNLVQGNFPKYEDIIPGDYTNSVTLPTDPTLSAVRRAALLANEDSKGIKLSLAKDKLVFSGRAPETGDAQVDMSVEYDGAPIDIGFNPQFLIDVLRVLKDDTFVLELGDSERPGLIRSGSEFLYLVMPVSL